MLFMCLQTIVLILAGLMVGNEVAVGAFVHPQLYKLEDTNHAASAQALARIYGAAMPIWYVLTLILTIAIAILLRQAGLSFWFAVASVLLWGAAILLTVTSLVPINNQVSRWNLERLPRQWKHLRQQWDNLHIIRVVILTLALICLTISCLIAV